jgi:dihydroxy-acid dehydratase
MKQPSPRKSAALCGLENADIRNVIKGMGFSDDDLTSGRPVIGIANAWSTLVPGHFNFREISEQVKKGIHRAGGTAFEFGVIGLCDCRSQDGLLLRPALAGGHLHSVEILARATPDGLVCFGSCDKNRAGM